MKKITYTKLSRIIDIPLIKDGAELCFAEANRHIPFKINRFYFIYKAQDEDHRGLHAHRKLQQVLFCIQGSITLVLDNGFDREEIYLDNPNKGVLIGNMVWREMKHFKKDTILLVIASEYYQEKDYIRNYNQFLLEARSVVNVKSVMFKIKEFFGGKFFGVSHAIHKRFSTGG